MFKEHPLDESLKINSMRYLWENSDMPEGLSYSLFASRMNALVENHLSDTNYIEGQKTKGIYAYADSLILRCFIKHFNIKNVVELGCGASSTIMCEEGCKVTSFTIGDMGPVDRENHTLLLRDGRAQTTMDEMVSMLPNTDMIFIDTPHSYEFSINYVEKLLKFAKDKFVVIHDCYNFDRPLISGENHVVNNFVVGKTHQLYIQSDSFGFCPIDIKNRFVELTSDRVLQDIIGPSDWNVKSGNGPTLPAIAMCSYFLAPLGVE